MEASIQTINSDNWNFAAYKAGNLVAQITFGAEPAEPIEFLYHCSVLNEEGEAIFQKTFHDLSLALTHINRNYGHWEFLDRSQGQGGGCGTCQAH